MSAKMLKKAHRRNSETDRANGGRVLPLRVWAWAVVFGGPLMVPVTPWERLAASRWLHRKVGKADRAVIDAGYGAPQSRLRERLARELGSSRWMVPRGA